MKLPGFLSKIFPIKQDSPVKPHVSMGPEFTMLGRTWHEVGPGDDKLPPLRASRMPFNTAEPVAQPSVGSRIQVGERPVSIATLPGRSWPKTSASQSRSAKPPSP